MSDGRGDFDGQQAGDAHQEAEDALDSMSWYASYEFRGGHTVIAEPQRKVLKGDIPVVKGPGSERRVAIAGTSPPITTTGIKAMAL